MKREHIVNFSYIVAAFLGVVMIQSLLVQPNQMRSIPYSEYQKLVLDGKVTDLVVGQTQIAGTYKQPEGSVQHFATDRVDPTLAQDLARTGVSFSGQPGPGLLQTVLTWLSIIVATMTQGQRSRCQLGSVVMQQPQRIHRDQNCRPRIS